MKGDDLNIMTWIREMVGYFKLKTEMQKQINRLMNDIGEQGEANMECWKQKKELETQLELIEEQILKLQDELEENPQEEYWNNRYPKQTISYNGRTFPNGNSYSIDVRHFFQATQPLVEIVEANDLNRGSYDERALKCLQWVKAKFKYKSDSSVFGVGEYWSTPAESLFTMEGDCDSGSILLASLMFTAEIPYWRIRLNAGSVEGGGHAYLTYCRETDDQFVVADWCYWPNNEDMGERELHKDKEKYFGVWFSFNALYTFGKMQTMKGMPKHMGVSK